MAHPLPSDRRLMLTAVHDNIGINSRTPQRVVDCCTFNNFIFLQNQGNLSMASVTNRVVELEEIVERLVRGLEPERIYLFGSLAHGQADEGSDIDLLVVVPSSDLPRHQREAISYDLLWGLTTPVDVIVLTSEEFNRTSRVKTSLAATVQSQGVLIYG